MVVGHRYTDNNTANQFGKALYGYGNSTGLFVSFYELWHCLDQGGVLIFEGQSPQELSLPSWRASITYISQARVNLKGTPAELYFSAQKFTSQRGRERGDLPALVFQLGLEQVVLNQPWAELSVGTTSGC